MEKLTSFMIKKFGTIQISDVNKNMFLIMKNLFKTRFNLKQFLLSIRSIRNDCKLYQKSDHNIKCLDYGHLEKDNEDISSHIRYNRKLVPPKVEDFQQLYGNDLTIKLNVELICAEFNLVRLTSNRVKNCITESDMKQLLEMATITRQKFYNISYLKDTKSIRNKLKKIAKKRDQQNDNQINHNKETNECPVGVFNQNGQIRYGLWCNSMFTRISYPKNSVIIHQRNRNAALFGQSIVIDWNSDFESDLHKFVIRKLINQIKYIYSNNRYRYSDPYYLHFCNLNPNSITYQQLSNFFEKFDEKDFYVNVTEKSYLELFSKQNIIYITSYAEEVLETYDHNAVYVMSPLLEKRAEKSKDFIKEHFSGENVKFLRLPFEKHIKLKNKPFVCMNHWVDCMNDVKNGAHWKQAFERHVPRNKVIDSIGQQYENVQKLIKKRKLDFDLLRNRS